MGKDVIVACDFPTREACMDFLLRFPGRKPYVKIGMELFYAAGPDMVRALKDRGHPIFLDLKLYDIPNTVRGAMSVLRDLGADMLNLHAAGTSDMMTAALEGLTRPDGTRPLLLAVTRLTSLSEAVMRREQLIDRRLEDVVLAYAQNAQAAGLDGVVCSPLEAATLHRALGATFLTVTPGIRFPEDGKDDQTRVSTPAGAKVLGSDYIVVGRPITRAADPAAVYERCVREFVDS